MYKAGEPPFHKGEYMRLLEKVNPFRQQYGFVPGNPIFFSEELRNMYEKWKSPAPLNFFYGKAAFFQFVYEIYEELEQGDIPIFEPDVVAMAIRYLDKSYSEPIVIQEMCEMLGVSYSHFHRSFKHQTGKSPRDYLINTRLTAAMELLKNSQTSIREIADYCGFQDERNLQRTFSKNIGITPSAFRENVSHDMRDGVLGNLLTFPYNEKGQVSYDELKEKGASYMFKQIRNKTVAAAALSLMVILSACSTTTVNTNGTNIAQPSAVTAQSQDMEATESVNEGTKIISTAMGDVEVPVNPKRVVVIFVQGDVLALGITPVGTSFNTGAVFENEAQEISVIDAYSINEEEIMALDPDLILWNTEDETTYQALSNIAPTIACDYFGMNYQERLRFMGEVLNRSEKAEELIQAFESKIENAKQKLADEGLGDKSVLCIEKREDVLSASWLGRGGPLMYDLLGFKAPEKLQEAMKDSKNAQAGGVKLSYEVINEYAGDFILVNGTMGDFGDNDIWKNLPAVKEDRVISAPVNMFWFNDIISMNAQVDLILDSILENK
jgi:iron complex transport system substrate-binding protein